MAENKNARTSADGPEYERGFVDGMQRQMQLSVRINKESTKIFGPGLEELLNSAGFYRRKWVGLTDEEIQDLSYLSQKIDEGNEDWFDRWGFARAVEQALKEKNHG